MSRDGLIENRRIISTALLVAALLFLLLHPYRGLTHDARLYTIQALGHLRADLYAADIFLRLGSQDDFTLFSPIYAAVIGWIGLEPAAALLSAVSLTLFAIAVWVLARTLMSAGPASAVMVLLFLLPAHYGSGRVFHYLEGFVTPRQLSAAITLLGLSLLIRGKPLASLATGLCAMLIHPLIALPGIALTITMRWGIPLAGRLWPWALGFAAIASIVVALGWLPSKWEFDADWHAIVMTRSYLTMETWSSDDWSRVLTVGATLAIAAMSLPGLQRQLAGATLLTSTALMLAALIGTELRLVIAVQSQFWRVLWLATVVAVVLMPPLYAAAWRHSSLARSSVLLLAAAWIAPQGALAFAAAPLSLLISYLRTTSVPASTERIVRLGSLAVLMIALVHGTAVSWLAWNENLEVVDTLPPVLQKVTLLADCGVVPGILVAALGGLLYRHRSIAIQNVTLLAAAMCAIALSIPAARAWAPAEYKPALVSAYAPWRSHIPAGTEVLWVDNAPQRASMSTWLLLQRPSYMSVTQAPNALFSRSAALEMNRRADAISRSFPFPHPFSEEDQSAPPPPATLQSICQQIDVGHIVTNFTVLDADALPAPAGVALLHRNHKLYTCP